MNTVEKLRKQQDEAQRTMRDVMRRRAVHLQVLAETHASDPAVAKLRKEEQAVVAEIEKAREHVDSLRVRMRDAKRGLEKLLEKYLPEELQ